jgi:exodeoxyribonuclease III
MRLISWNVNGLRAVVKKNFYETFQALDADIFALQETKLQEGQIELALPDGYHQFWSYAQRKGYSGTAVLSRHEPLSVRHELGDASLDDEGRLCALEFPTFWFVNVYTPNSQSELARIDHRMAWEDAFRSFLLELKTHKSVVVCGDFNVAHNEIDLKNPQANRGNAGFSDEERAKFSKLLGSGFIDTFRYLHPEDEEAYSWWSYRAHARARNAGWRIDYFLTSEELASRISSARILSSVHGSDHCPVELDIEW